MNKAMNLTYGDLIIIEIALVTYMKELDLSMQAGQYISMLLGKVEYELSQIQQSADMQLPPVADVANTNARPPITP